jgi:LDH2 family malate/lactate/ureidoglycolate dehydrogenase
LSEAAPVSAIEVTDLVVSIGTRGRETVVLAGLSIEVRRGELVALEVDDVTAQAILVDVLAGRRRPLYGSVRSAAGALAVLRPHATVAVGGPCVVVADTADAPADWYERLRGLRPAAVVIGPAAALATVPADRRLRLADGYVWPVPARDVAVAVPMLRARVRAAIAGTGADDATADRVAEVLVDADVRGHSSHGVQLLPMYLDRAARGGIVPRAEPRWLRRNGAVRVLDAAGGFGQVAASMAAEECARVAGEHGIAAVAVRGNNHVGMLAAYREPFLRRGIVALILNISGPSVAPPGAGKASMGNNAICMICPSGPDGQPLISDFATGTVASGKIRDAAARGRQVPTEWLVDKAGRPTTDPHALDSGGAVPVFGGYKGLGVSVIVEVLAGMLAGATISPLVHKQRQEPERAMDCSQMFIGFDPAAFAGGDLAALGERLRAAVAAGYGGTAPEIYFPEQQERRRERAAATAGVSLPLALATTLGLAGPAAADVEPVERTEKAAV